MFESTSARADVFARMQAHVATKDGPLRVERLSGRLFGIEWRDLAASDQRIILGALKRLGWTQGKWPYWWPAGSPALEAQAV